MLGKLSSGMQEIYVAKNTCINSLLQSQDIYDDTRLQAEYRLVSKNYDINFQHYMWNKFANMPVEGYNILSIGYNGSFDTTSYTNGLLYNPNKNSITRIHIDKFLDEDFLRIRKFKNLRIATK